MKAFKKVSAWLLSLGMAVSLMAAVPVTAAGKPTTGSITVHKFIVETQTEYNKLVEANKNSGGNKINITEDETLKKLKPMAGIKFDLEKVVDDGTTVLKPDTATLDQSFTKQTLATDREGNLTFANLELGTYKLSEQDDPRVKTKMKPVLISVPTYNQAYKDGQSQQEFLYDVHVYPKNLIYEDGPSIQKDVVKENNNDATVDRYAPFDWIIVSDIPQEVENEQMKAKKYVITDKLDWRLDFVSEVSVVFRTKDKVTSTTMVKGTDYTFTQEDLSGEQYPNHKPGNKSSLKWELTDTGLGKLKDYAGGSVVITFKTKLNGEAGLGTAIQNQAVLDYTNYNNHEYVPESDIPEVHTGGIKIKKVDKSNPATTLQGAKFMIYTSEEAAKTGDPKQAVQRNGKAYEVTSGTDGIAFFDGLSYGGATGEVASTNTKTPYWIVETKAPEGFNRLHDPLKVEVSATSHLLDGEKLPVVYNAKNNYELPFTGGTGLIVFLGAGAVLLIAAYVVSKGGKSKAAK